MAIRDAATVMLVRDGSSGLEVFMLRRSPKSNFVPGQFVFPGGAVDTADREDPGLGSVCFGLDDRAASTLLDVGSGGLAYWVAAVRECFEEAGVLLARGEVGDVSFADDAIHARFEGLRQKVYDGELRLAEMCVVEGLRLELDDLRYVSHWITPVGPPRRFDTRFFLARAPENQRPFHDGGETVASTWIRPADAMQLHSDGKFEMILPTIANLESLTEHDTVDSAIGWADNLGAIPRILPAIVVNEGGPPSVLMPWDEGYSAALIEPPAEGLTI